MVGEFQSARGLAHSQDAKRGTKARCGSEILEVMATFADPSKSLLTLTFSLDKEGTEKEAVKFG